MASFNTSAFRDKLVSLNSTQASIETVSQWCVFHRKQAAAVVSVWDDEYAKAPPPKRLVMLYLANDILQNSRRKGPEFVTEFFKVMPRSLKHSLRHFDDATRGRINRLVSVWDQRKVFGNTGTRTLKELLAEAETPTKRALSARTGGPSPADADGMLSPAAGVPPQLHSLAAAQAAARDAGAASSSLAGRCDSVLQKGLLEAGGPDELHGASDLLREYSGALGNEARAVDAALAALQSLTSQQLDARQQVRDQEAAAARQLQACSGRLAQLTGQPQPPVAEASPRRLSPRPEAAPPVSSDAGTPPLPAAPAPPLPAMSSAAGSTPMPVAPMPPPASEGSPALPPQGQPPLPSENMDVDDVVASSAVGSMPFSSGPLSNGHFGDFAAAMAGGGGDDEAAAAAAALVAQLSAANDSNALLEALAALPQDQQREISLSFLNSAAAGGGGGADEEYNPEDPGF